MNKDMAEWQQLHEPCSTPSHWPVRFVIKIYTLLQSIYARTYQAIKLSIIICTYSQRRPLWVGGKSITTQQIPIYQCSEYYNFKQYCGIGCISLCPRLQALGRMSLYTVVHGDTNTWVQKYKSTTDKLVLGWCCSYLPTESPSLIAN